jgi:hypothetical protein
MLKEKAQEMKVKILYIGERFYNDALTNVFIVPGSFIGKRPAEVTWSKLNGCEIGNLYFCNRNKKNHTIKNLPDFAGKGSCSEEEIATWQALTFAAREKVRRLRAAKRIEKVYGIESLISKVDEVCSEIKDTYEIRALLDHIVNEVFTRRHKRF